VKDAVGVIGGPIVIREAAAADMPGITRVRTSVVENALTIEQLDERGITEASIAASFLTDSKGWVAVRTEEIVAFSIADRATQSIFALFVLPGYEGRGIGGRLLDLALAWLWDNGAKRIWLTTAAGTRAARFYEKRGWTCTGTGPRGDLRYELGRPEA
jgi:GNAT superfamily N-acetyltransferase